MESHQFKRKTLREEEVNKVQNSKKTINKMAIVSC